MFFSKKLIVAATAISGAIAQRPEDTSICDYYSKALLNQSTAATQKTLLTLLVNTAVIGNYTQPNMNAVPGILAPNATYMGNKVNLVPYFSGGFASTNTGGDSGESVNFLDGGGAAPLMKNMPANDEDSNQYTLLTHLYSYFGALLECSELGMGGFPAYDGSNSQYNVHKYMGLDENEVGYFIQQVGLAAASFGVTQDDVKYVGNALNMLFGYRCSPPTEVIPDSGEKLQSICIADSCPKDPDAVCDQYDTVMEPSMVASSSGSMPSATGGMGGGNDNDDSDDSDSGSPPAMGGAGIAAASTGLIGLMAAGAMLVLA